MIVPNYVPEPVSVPRNVTEEPYRERLRFIRAVTYRHLASAIFVAAAGAAYPWSGRIIPCMALAALACFSLLRAKALRGFDAGLSPLLLPLVLAVVGAAGRCLMGLGVPVWSCFAGLGCAVAYCALCGRDFSFVGQYFLSLVPSSLLVAVACPLLGLGHREAGLALLLNASYLLYFCYDLASLLSRRQKGEAWAAVADLYRDVWNFVGWSIRVVRHWRKHRIFTLPQIEPREPLFPLAGKGRR